MKRLAPFFLSIIVFGCSHPEYLIFYNKTITALADQPLVLDRTDLNYGGNDFFIFQNENGMPIPVQFDDLDGDGLWDEVALELNFDASGTRKFTFKRIPESELPEFEIKTGAHLGYSPKRDNEFESIISNTRPIDHSAQSTPFLYQYEGPGWESDKVAFRAYFDSRNGKDIFGKRQPDLVAHKIGLNENYHELRDWGMDVLKVGNSLGAGAIAMIKNDSIYRLTNTLKSQFRIITEGPVRSIIEFQYTGWEVTGVKYDLTETISIWAGKRSYQSEIMFSGNESDTLVTGIVNLKNLVSKQIEGTNSNMLYTHGKQSENKDILGLGLIVPKSGLIGFDQAPNNGAGVTYTYTALLKPTDGVYQFAFYVGWELENADFKSEDYFSQLLQSETITFNNSIEIKRKP